MSIGINEQSVMTTAWESCETSAKIGLPDRIESASFLYHFWTKLPCSPRWTMHLKWLLSAKAYYIFIQKYCIVKQTSHTKQMEKHYICTHAPMYEVYWCSIIKYIAIPQGRYNTCKIFWSHATCKYPSWIKCTKGGLKIHPNCKRMTEFRVSK